MAGLIIRKKLLTIIIILPEKLHPSELFPGSRRCFFKHYPKRTWKRYLRRCSSDYLHRHSLPFRHSSVGNHHDRGCPAVCPDDGSRI